MHRLQTVLRHLRRLTGQESGGSSDDQLLERWIDRRDDAAFEVLVWRHGPMVLGLCRHLLGNAQDAEDAFQATFLTLIRKASSIGRREAVGSWLYKVAYRVALTARQSVGHSALPPRAALIPADPIAGVVQRELQRAVREEVGRLPEKYRAPVVLCQLEGKTHGEAAQELGWAKGTVTSRLARARDLLRSRLLRRGLALSAACIASELSAETTSAAVPASLAAAAVRFAGLYATDPGGVAAASTRAVALAEGVMRAMFVSKIKAAVAVVLAVGVVALGTGLIARQVHSGRPEAAVGPPGADPEKKEAVDLRGDPLPPGVMSRLGTTRFRHTGYKSVLEFSSDGKNLLTVEQTTSALRVWDPATGKLVRQIDLSPRPPSQEIVLSADAKVLGAVGYLRQEPDGAPYGALCLWDAATGKERLTFKVPKPPDGTGTVAITPDGKTVAFSQSDGNVRFLDVESGAEILQSKLTRRAAQAMAFSPDGSTLAVAGGRDEPSLFLWEWDAGKKPRAVKLQDEGARSLAFSPDGRKLATGAGGKEVVQLWEVASGRLLHTWKVATSGNAFVSYSPDGKTVAAACGLRAQAVVFWDPDTGKELHRLDVGRDGASRVAFSPDCKRVAAGTYAVVRVWEVDGWKELGADEAAHRRPVGRIAFSPHGDLVATAGEDDTVRIWEAATGRQRSVLRHDGWTTEVALSPDGKWLASSALDDSVRVWDVATGKPILKLPGHGVYGGRRALRFSPDGKRLASWGDQDNYIRVWDMSNGKALLEHKVRPSGVVLPDEEDVPALNYGLECDDATFSPDGKTLVLALHDGVRIFEVESGKEALHIPNEDGYFYSVAISPDGKRVLAGASGKQREVRNPDGTVTLVPSGPTIRVWDLSSGKLLLKNVLNKGWMARVSFTPDGKRFAAITHDPGLTVRLWDADTGEEVRMIEGLPSRSYCMAFSPDGKQLAVGLEDTTALVYDLTFRLPKEKP